jgi:enamine deaminase RidA (YjgF/YER057c/UK114 family)
MSPEPAIRTVRWERTMPHSSRVVLAAAGVSLLALLASGCAGATPPAEATPAAPPLVARLVLPVGQADPMIAEGVLIGANQPVYETSGVGPKKLNAGAPDGTPESYVDPEQFPGGALGPGVSITEAQSMNALARIRENLEAQGLRLDNVTSMRVFLDNPPGADRADYAGWNRAYRQFFANTNLASGDTTLEPLGTAPPAAPVVRNPARPTRSTFEVQSLAAPGWLVEIEVDAVYPAGQHPR